MAQHNKKLIQSESKWGDSPILIAFESIFAILGHPYENSPRRRPTATRIRPGRFIWFMELSVDWFHFAELWTNLKVFVGRLGSIFEPQGFVFEGCSGLLGVDSGAFPAARIDHQRPRPDGMRPSLFKIIH